jgi:hypothetical protein
MENKWILEDAVSILKTLGHINLWYLERAVRSVASHPNHCL